MLQTSWFMLLLVQGSRLLYGLPDYQIKQLQCVHNTAAMILTLTRKYDHITPVLNELHWLPIKQRISFKFMTLTYRYLHGLAPPYLASLLVQYSPVRSLRSSGYNQLCENKTRTKSYGDRAFQNVLPKLWDKHPNCIRKCDTLTFFKSKLKHYLFEESYKCIWTFCGTLCYIKCVFYSSVFYSVILETGALIEKWSKNTRNNYLHTNLCFSINNKHLKFSNICSALASQVVRLLHKMALFEGVALMTWFEIVSYSVAVLQFDLQYALLWK